MTGGRTLSIEECLTIVGPLHHAGKGNKVKNDSGGEKRHRVRLLKDFEAVLSRKFGACRHLERLRDGTPSQRVVGNPSSPPFLPSESLTSRNVEGLDASSTLTMRYLGQDVPHMGCVTGAVY
jgi:hypothetical protein